MIAGATYAPLRCMPWLKYSKVVSGWWLVVRIFVGKWTADSRKGGVILSDSEGSSEGVGSGRCPFGVATLWGVGSGW